jgi:hypothetical protein
MALGAARADVLRLVLREGLGIVGAGAAAGLLAAFACVRFVKAFLFQVDPLDPIAFAAATLVLLAVAGLAAYRPPRAPRASIPWRRCARSRRQLQETRDRIPSCAALSARMRTRPWNECASASLPAPHPLPPRLLHGRDLRGLRPRPALRRMSLDVPAGHRRERLRLALLARAQRLW